ncbi:MAG: anthranilate phosphoribosyltransferase [Hyphomicrobium sp.]
MTPPHPDDIKGYLKLLSRGQQLSSHQIFNLLDTLSGETAKSDQRAAFLMALSLRGEKEDELLGAIKFLRSRMISIPTSPDCVDIVGTGGDGFNTYNISTASAFVAAGAGAKVVKHGNKSVSSRSGATDVLSALGINISLSPDKSVKILNEIGLCFLWAQTHHPVLKPWSTTRSDLGIRTIFNLVGPLCNPGNVKRQVVGVSDPKFLFPIADVLKILGTKHAWIVCGHDGLDELSTTGPSYVVELREDKISEFEITPEQLSIQRSQLSDIIGGDPQTNAQELRAILSGKLCPYRDIVLLNTAALLLIGGIVPNIQKGVEGATKSIDEGLALDKLNKLIKFSNI